MNRQLLVSLAVVGAWLASLAPAGAHRLDEYLQATRVSIGLDRVDLEIDLTPGVGVAPGILASIDVDGDNQISAAESVAYARQMIGSVSLMIDGRPEPVTLVDHQFPDVRDIRAGQGTIRLRATVKLSAVAVGAHRVSYLNAHRPDVSVYLVNALVPDDPRIGIANQQRDQAQHGLTVDYNVKPWARGWLLSGLAMLGVLVITRRPGTLRRP